MDSDRPFNLTPFPVIVAVEFFPLVIRYVKQSFLQWNLQTYGMIWQGMAWHGMVWQMQHLKRRRKEEEEKRRRNKEDEEEEEREELFRQQILLKCKEEISEMLCWKHSFLWCWSLATSESRSEIPWKFWNVVLEKDGEDRMDRMCEKRRSVRGKEERNFLHTIKIRKANCFIYVLRRNCSLKHVIEGKVEVKRRRGRRRKQLLDKREDTGHWKGKH